MDGINFVIILAFLATIAVFLIGQVSMARGGKYDDDHAAEFMSIRSLLQLTAFLLIMIALFV